MTKPSLTLTKLLAVAAFTALGCSSDATPKRTSDAGTTNDTATTADVGSAQDSNEADVTVVPTSCEELQFRASGETCDSCQLNCDCPDGFPISIAHCTDDGCLQGANCDAVCLAGLEFAFDCTDVYSTPLPDGAACTERSECASSNCIQGECARWETQWSRAFHTSPVAGELQNEVAIEGLAVDDFGLRAAIYSKYGNSVDGGVLTLGRVIGFDGDGELRFSSGFPGDRVSALHVVDDDSLVTVRFSRTISVGGEMLTPDDDDDWYVARVTTESDIVWSQHLLASTRQASAVAVGDVYVVAYNRSPDELVIAGFSMANGDLRWETVLSTSGNYGVATSAPDAGTALVIVTANTPATIGASNLTEPGTVALRVDISNGTVEPTVLTDLLTLIGSDAESRQYFSTGGATVRTPWADGALGDVEPLPHSAVMVTRGGDFTAAIVNDGWAHEALAAGVVRVEPTGQTWWLDGGFPRSTEVAVAEDGTVYVGAAGAGVRVNGETFGAADPRQLRASLFFFEIGP